MSEMLDNQGKNQGVGYKNPPKEYQWKKGQSGNEKGRPPGKTLKEFAKEYLMSLPDDEKIDYLETLPTDIIWKMAEGNPQNDTVVSGNLSISQVLEQIENDNQTQRQTMEDGQPLQDSGQSRTDGDIPDESNSEGLPEEQVVS